mmetsp:Transcript_20459/g.26371  ORF Transcript_20459/g.26371 Transcript_20459/m.26371 type:complete len:110 (+) Transcript_20459:56-385(+)
MSYLGYPMELDSPFTKKKTFAVEILPNYFKASKFTSFTRKLNRWDVLTPNATNDDVSTTTNDAADATTRYGHANGTANASTTCTAKPTRGATTCTATANDATTATKIIG